MKDEEGSPARLQARIWFERGRHLFNIDRFADALTAFERAEAADPSFPPANTGKANALIMLGRAEEALAACDELIAREPTFALAYTTRGNALHRLGRAAEALPAYRRGVALGPQESAVFYNYACFWAAEGNETECRKYLTRALELNPDAHTKAAIETDFAPFSDREWFRKLVASAVTQPNP